MNPFNCLSKTFFTVVLTPVVWLAAAGSTQASVTNVVETYNFSQSGWSGGGLVTGSFTLTFPAGSTVVSLNNTFPVFSFVQLDGNPNGADFALGAIGPVDVEGFQFSLDANYHVVADPGNVLDLIFAQTGIVRPEASTNGVPYTPPIFPYYPNNLEYVGTTSDGNVTSLLGDLYSATTSGIVFDYSTVPEPGTLALAGLGGLACLAFRQKKV